MTNVYLTNTTEFHRYGKDGVVRHNGKYGLLLNKPTVPNVSFDRVTYVSDGTKANTFRTFIHTCAGIENVDFVYGELFPK